MSRFQICEAKWSILTTSVSDVGRGETNPKASDSHGAAQLSSARPPPAPGGRALALIATGGLLTHTEWEPLDKSSRIGSLHGAAVLLRGSNWKVGIWYVQRNSKSAQILQAPGRRPVP